MGFSKYRQVLDSWTRTFGFVIPRQVLWAVGIVVVVLALIVLIRIGYALQWTGFGQIETKGDVKPSKTLWDWLKLLIVPAVLAVGGYLFTRSESRATQAAAGRQHRTTQAAAKRQHRATQEAAERQFQATQEAAERQAQEEALQAYLDQMAEMLIPNNDQPTLYDENPPESLRVVARARTRTVLPRLDGDRKASVVQFLYESNLIDKDRAVLDLSGANLSGADLRGVDLSDADLRRADLRQADLRRASVHYRYRSRKRTAYSNAPTQAANLSGANLSEADLRGVSMSDEDVRGNAGTNLRGANLSFAKLDFANLSGANLSEADLRRGAMFGTDLRWANLSRADLSGVDLSKTHLSGADLSGADLSKANLRWVDLSGVRGITNEELAQQARSLEGATMPDGSKHA